MGIFFKEAAKWRITIGSCLSGFTTLLNKSLLLVSRRTIIIIVDKIDEIYRFYRSESELKWSREPYIISPGLRVASEPVW